MICERLQIVYVVLLHVVLRSPCAFFTMVRFSFLQVGSNRGGCCHATGRAISARDEENEFRIH